MAEGVDQRGETLPTLTKRSSNVKIDKIIIYQKADFSSKKLATPGFWPLVKMMVSQGLKHQFKSIIIEKDEYFDSENKGLLAVSWHIAGLVDPMLIINPINKPFAFAGRHDLITGPIIGFWGRRIGAQPLLRQAEIKRGHVDAETAKSVNGKSLLTVAAKLAHGQASMLLPEGHSHQESHLIRLRTGPLRSALNAAAIATELGNPKPIIAPVGLTFREPTGWFTDVYVDFSQPIEIPTLPDCEHGKNLTAGEWIEPDEQTTLVTRDLLRDRLGPLTPDAPNWETWRAWLLLAHLSSEQRGDELLDWGAEVRAARDIRDTLRGSDSGVWHGPESVRESDPASESDIVLQAKKVAKTLNENDLDGRAVTPHLINNISKNYLLLLLMIPLVMLTSPLAFAANGIQWIVGEILCRYNGEAIDKKTTYQSMPSALGVVYIRLPILFILTYVIVSQSIIDLPTSIPFIGLSILTFVCLNIVFEFSLLVSRIFLRLLLDLRFALRARNFKKSSAWKTTNFELSEIRKSLGVLK